MTIKSPLLRCLRRAAQAITVLLISCSSGFAQQDSLLHEQQAYTYFDRARQEGDVENLRTAQAESLAAVEAALPRHEVRRNSLWLLGEASVELGDRATLDRIYSAVLAQDENPQTYVDYAEALAKLRDPQAAVMLQRALALNPDIGRGPYGEWLLDHGREQEVLALVPPGVLDHYAHFLLGVALERLGETGKALAEYRQYQAGGGLRIPFSEAFPAPRRFRLPGSSAQAEAGIRFDDKPESAGQGSPQAASVSTVLQGLAFLISGEAGGEPRGVKRGVGWEVRNSVLRGAVQRTNTTQTCPVATNAGSNLQDQYVSAMCFPNRFQGLCTAWCSNGSSCATPSQESMDVAMNVYNGIEPDPVGQWCPGGFAAGSTTDDCATATRCNGDLLSYSLGGGLFNYGTTGTCPVNDDLHSCTRSDTLMGKTCGGATCFYNNYYIAPAQADTNGSALPVGGSTLSQVQLSGYVPYQSTGNLRLETELRRLDEYGGTFQGTPTQTGPWSARSTSAITVFGLIDGSYHWRARLADMNGNTGPWLSFGGNSDSAADFQVSTSCGAGSLSGACGGAALSLTLAGSGSGRVVSNPVGIDCPGNCSTIFSIGTQVSLSAVPVLGSTFTGWSGDPACASGTVTLSTNHSCMASFTAMSASYPLTVSKSGSGTVASADGGINCGTACNATYLSGTTVTLTASAAAGWAFSAWSGSCSGGPVAQLAMNGAKSCTATFVQAASSAPVVTTGSATSVNATSATLNGTINPEGLAATAYFQYGPDPDLNNATPGVPFGAGNNMVFPYAQTVTGLACATTYRFRAVGVSSSGQDFIAANNTFTTASCPPAPCYPLTLLVNGDAPAPAASPTNATGCPFGQYHAGDSITLSVAPVPGDVLLGWSGTDNNASTASVNTATMPAFNLWVFAIYQHICYHLSLGYTGQGSTPVATNPVSYCPTGYYPWGYEVDVSGASPATGWQITGWSGTEYDYSQLDHNFILMPQQSATALVQFTPEPIPLSVMKVGNGSGTVTSDVPGIDCGGVCTASFPFGSTVTLSATPGPGSMFLGFSGGTCNSGVPTMTSAIDCSAVFGLTPGTTFHTLTPCRVIDTRPTSSALPALSSVLVPVAGTCGVPPAAKAVAVNVTAVGPSAPGFLTVYPGSGPPSTWTVAFRQGTTRAASTLIGLNPDGTVNVFNSMTTGRVDFLIDVSGYFE